MCAQAGLLKSKCQKFVKSHISVLVEELTTSDSVRTICVNVKACKSVAVTCPRARRSSYSNRTWIAQTNDWKHHTSKRSDSLVSFFSRRSCKLFCSSVHVNFFFFFLFSQEKRRLLPKACTTWKRKWNWNWRNISERLNWMSAWRLPAVWEPPVCCTRPLLCLCFVCKLYFCITTTNKCLMIQNVLGVREVHSSWSVRTTNSKINNRKAISTSNS